KSAAQPVEPPCHKEHQGTRAPDRRQGIHSDKLSRHDRIRYIVKLLEDIPQAHWDHKTDDQPHRASGSHIACLVRTHNAPSPVCCFCVYTASVYMLLLRFPPVRFSVCTVPYYTGFPAVCNENI